MMNQHLLKRFVENKSLWVFSIVAIILLSSARWSMGIWDSPEFAFAGANFQLTHAPGAPFYIIILNIFQGVFFFVTPYQSAVLLSILCSCVMSVYLFKTALLLHESYMKKAVLKETWLYGFIAVGIGGLNLTVWELSYEVEVYSMSGMFFSLLLYMIIQFYSDRISTAFFIKSVSILIFLSLGVHKLNLLILLPVFYVIIRKAKYHALLSNRFVSLLMSVLLLAITLFLHSLFLKFAVVIALFLQDYVAISQNLSFPLLGILLILIVAVLWYYKKAIATTILIASLFSYLWYVPFLNSPPEVGGYHISDTESLVNHINANQFGLQKTPFLLGKKYNEKIDIATGKEKTNGNEIWFPRMHSTKYYDVTQYPKWDDASIRNSHDGHHFTWSYQVYSLYLRYLGTNFLGRSNIHKNSGTHINHSVSSYLYNSNPLKGYYKIGSVDYLGIPLLFIFLGIIYSFKNVDLGIILGVTFLLTGLAIILYLNPAPGSLRVRERDYISFFSFIICGFYAMLGVLCFCNFFPKIKKVFLISTVVLTLLFVLQNFKVQNKSNEDFNEAFSTWILDSIPENSVVLANGDNLTFPYWYQLADSDRSVVWINIELLHLDSYRNQLYNYIISKVSLNSLSLRDPAFSKAIETNIIKEVVPMVDEDSELLRTAILSLLNDKQKLFLQSNWAIDNKIFVEQGMSSPYLLVDDNKVDLKDRALNLLSFKASDVHGMNSQEMNILLDFYIKKANYLTNQLIKNEQIDLANQLSKNVDLFYDKFDLPKDGNAFNIAARLYELKENKSAFELMENSIEQNIMLVEWMIEKKSPMNRQLTLEAAESKVNLLDQMLVNYNKINPTYIQNNLSKIQKVNTDYLEWKNSILNDI
ncbi:uncharacterized protein DUF2723 [Nonlabens dokdonensis]|uniref:DUF2723 domain-containing protein n=2 Tax=Nonlabens dokdonensis TaxID=328515 RepID=L7W937_NONDD|nr:DUF2723 domain-containing protein [Nonlabens dokdonensis]AGC76311.1 hypothetical protein DDD_1184 [Nonlabens dokdonensis DSW-6]PZX43973.1 uncharacterized protein DUF2723 [Nonlabens dokdonensis]